jgi:hypothetical protein
MPSTSSTTANQVTSEKQKQHIEISTDTKGSNKEEDNIKQTDNINRNMMEVEPSPSNLNDKPTSSQTTTTTTVDLTPLPISPPALSKNQKSTRNQQQQHQNQTTRSNAPILFYPFDSHTYRIIKNWYPLRFKHNFPKKSILNLSEQKEFFDLNNKFLRVEKINKSETKLYKLYHHLKIQVDKERKEFQAFLEDYFKNAQEDYDYVSQTHLRYINEMLECMRASVNVYEKFYVKYADFQMNKNALLNNSHSVAARPTHKPNEIFQFEKILLQLGNVAKIIFPSITLDIQPYLTTDYTSLNKRCPVARVAKKLNKLRLSEDDNVRKLAVKYDCDMVMSNSAFISLVYHLSQTKQSNNDSLKIPVHVEDFEEMGKKRRVVLIEKPLLEKHLNAREKNEKFFKRSLMVSVVKQNPQAMRATRAAVKSRADAREKAADVEIHAPPPVESTAKCVTTSRELQNLNVDHSLIGSMDSFGFLDNKTVNTASLSIFNRNLSNNESIKVAEGVEEIAKRVQKEYAPKSPPPLQSESLEKSSKFTKTKSSFSDESSYSSSSEEDEKSKLLIIDSPQVDSDKKTLIAEEHKSVSIVSSMKKLYSSSSSEDENESLAHIATKLKRKNKIIENDEVPSSPPMMDVDSSNLILSFF